MQDFLLAFIPLFVAVDAIGVLPLLLGMLEGIDESRRRRVIVQSVLTAASVVVLFMLGGSQLLRILGVTVSDFMIAGGTLLFVLSLSDLLASEKTRRTVDHDTVGAVPIGVPLIAGPAVLATCLLLIDAYGWPVTLAAALLNVLLAGAIFWFALPVTRLLGTAGTRIVSKVSALLLAAIGVMMVRKGILLLAATLHHAADL